jgi:flavin reductase (DIM6/NTAB) family NADH-FMN oxidoreductase RutF
MDVQFQVTSVPSPDGTAGDREGEGGAAPAIERQQFKRALGSFATGVTLATTAVGSEWHGMTANAVMSVSLEPPLVALSVQQGTRMHTALRCSTNFALSILADDQVAVARYFADSSRPHNTTAFAQFPHHQGRTGAPLLDGTLAAIDCAIVATHQAGDHTLFIGQVVGLEVAASGKPLLYFRGLFT